MTRQITNLLANEKTDYRKLLANEKTDYNLLANESSAYRVSAQPVLGDVGLVVWNGHSVAHTQHGQQVQVAIVLKQQEQ